MEQALRPCELADQALQYAIASIFCFGVVVGPIAIYKAREAKKIIARNPHLSGTGKANAAIAIGIFGIALWMAAFIYKFARPSNHVGK